MKNLINETKRMQQLAGLITESQSNEVDQLTEIRQLVKEVIQESILSEKEKKEYTFQGKKYIESTPRTTGNFLEDEIKLSHSGEITEDTLFVRQKQSMTGRNKSMDPMLDSKGKPIVYKTTGSSFKSPNGKKTWKCVKMMEKVDAKSKQ